MNNKRPGMGEQLLRSLLLSFAIMWLITNIFGWPGQDNTKQATQRPPEVEKRATLDNAFVGLQGATPISQDAAKKEVAALQKSIGDNSGDKYSYWARLRTGLLQQYVLKDPASALKNYDAVIYHAAHDDVDAQAIFQKGDWQWFSSTSGATPVSTSTTPLPTRAEAVATLELLVQRGRTSSTVVNTPIFVPRLSGDASSFNPNALPTGGFEKKKIFDIRGTLENPNPQGILDRINQHHSQGPLNRGMDALVNALGADPKWSYGAAIILLAFGLRVLLQPINRRQYDSMKGMQKLGPEMKKLQEKHKPKPNDSPEVAREKQMRSFSEVRALQKEHGVNPTLGCALAFVQIPIFFFFVNPLMMHYEPKMDLVGASFGWVQNLARADYILLGLYGLSMLVSFRLSSTPPQDDMQKQMQIMSTWVFPIMLPFFMKGFSSAFILYWMAFNIVSMVFQYRMMKGYDPNRSVMKQLLGQWDTPAVPAVADIPARPKGLPKAPKSGSKEAAEAADTVKVSKVKSIAADEPLSETAGDANGHANGSANGHANGNGRASRANGNGSAHGSKPGEIRIEKLSRDGSSSGSTGSGAGSEPDAGGNGNGGASNGNSNNGGSAAQRARRRRRY